MPCNGNKSARKCHFRSEQKQQNRENKHSTRSRNWCRTSGTSMYTSARAHPPALYILAFNRCWDCCFSVCTSTHSFGSRFLPFFFFFCFFTGRSLFIFICSVLFGLVMRFNFVISLFLCALFCVFVPERKVHELFLSFLLFRLRYMNPRTACVYENIWLPVVDAYRQKKRESERKILP